MNDSIAALLGNGVSIAYNPDLRLSSINAEISARINAEAKNGGEPIKLLQRAASRIDTGDPTTDFEALFGPMEQYRDGVHMIQDLAALTGDNNRILQNAIQLTADYIEEIRRSGVGHVLDVIAQRSKASLGGGPEVRDLMEELMGALDTGQLTIGNLNYDSLVMAALTESFAPYFCDMTDGRFSTKTIDIDGYHVVGRPLRRTASFPGGRPIRLLHLHGSLSWLRDPEPDGQVWRFEIGGLRNANYWNAYRTGRTDWAPQVVLTNQASKTAEVAKYPYSLAYQGFEAQLVAADRWFICGYSFRDACVNDMLSRAWRKRRTPPLVLINTFGKVPSRRQVLRAVDWDSWVDPDPDEWLSITTTGVRALPRTPEWRAWERAARLTKAS